MAQPELSGHALVALFDRVLRDVSALTEAEIRLVMRSLKLPLYYFPAVQEALRQGRWRRSRNPIGYVRTVARREAIALGVADDPAERISLRVPVGMTHDQYIERLAAEDDFGERAGAVEAEDGAVEAEIDLADLARAAGLRPDEAMVLFYRIHGISRERALAMEGNPAKRRRLQAAWRRFDRRKCMQRAAEVLRAGKSFA